MMSIVEDGKLFIYQLLCSNRDGEHKTYWPSVARFEASPVPPKVSVMGYVANELARCSPSVIRVSPVLAMLTSESSAALS